MKEDVLLRLRNTFCLVVQCEPHLRTLLPAAQIDEMLTALTHNCLDDADWIALLDGRPLNFSLSMFPSQQEAARKQNTERDQMICLEVEEERLKVRDQRLTFFKKALIQDQHSIIAIKDVPTKVMQLSHLKSLAEIKVQAAKGERAVNGYQDKYMQVLWLPKHTLAIDKVHTFQQSVVSNSVLRIEIALL